MWEVGESMHKESAVHTGAASGEAVRGDCGLPSDLCEIAAQIMLYVRKMDEEYLKYRREET
jgi:hypothetical protein